ncbi:ABC transporter ATP-binding protein [Paenibacillus sp. JSM ZJ436]|uniref:ABC transporter ATP-binding protein n=1 Tax=Paenibacillus sp. JSM ZJ436 TaxID=3376190 RepID=UPI0037ADA218
MRTAAVVKAVHSEQLSYRYDGESSYALKEVNLEIFCGSWTAIIGASGSGKSTLCQLLNGTLPRSGGGLREGKLEVMGLDPAAAELAEIIPAAGVLFQEHEAQLVRGIVEDEVAFGPENLCHPPEEVNRRIDLALAAVQLSDRRHDAVRRLSGGQRQRTAIAAVLSLQPQLLVFDDACASLDAAAQGSFLQLCTALQEEGRTVITAAGRFDDAARSASRVIVLSGGGVVLDGPPAELLRRCHGQLAELGLLPRLPREAAAAAPLGPALLEVKGLTFTYPGGRRALAGAAFTLRRGEWALLTGKNGSGKTTLSRLLMGLAPAPRGTISYEGRDLAGRPVHETAALFGYVFQQPEHMFTSHSVWEELIYGLHGGLPPAQRPELTPQQRELAEELLAEAGLTARLEASPYLLSRGERRLLAVICQLILPKALYILDEPTAGMDYLDISRIVKLCRSACHRGAAVLLITHDPELLAAEATLSLHLDGGRLTAVPAPQTQL